MVKAKKLICGAILTSGILAGGAFAAQGEGHDGLSTEGLAVELASEQVLAESIASSLYNDELLKITWDSIAGTTLSLVDAEPVASMFFAGLGEQIMEAMKLDLEQKKEAFKGRLLDDFSLDELGQIEAYVNSKVYKKYYEVHMRAFPKVVESCARFLMDDEEQQEQEGSELLTATEQRLLKCLNVDERLKQDPDLAIVAEHVKSGLVETFRAELSADEMETLVGMLEAPLMKRFQAAIPTE